MTAEQRGIGSSKAIGVLRAAKPDRGARTPIRVELAGHVSGHGTDTCSSMQPCDSPFHSRKLCKPRWHANVYDIPH